MNEDLSEFYQEFFDESLEQVENIESILINSKAHGLAKDELDEIFRGVHSVKGGCGMFAFFHLANFTHNFETLMDEIRQDQREITPAIIDILLEGNDAIKQSINALINSDTSEQPEAKKINVAILKILEANAEDTSNNESVAEDTSNNESVAEDTNNKESVAEDTNNNESVAEDTSNNESVAEDTSNNESVAEDTSNNESVAEDTSSAQQVKSNMSNEYKLALKPRTQTITKKPTQSIDSIRIATYKIDSIINQIGELIITKSMLNQRYRKVDNKSGTLFEQSLMQLEHNVRELQESILELRMVPIESIFKWFPRLVRDLSKQTNKTIELKIEGEQTEIDKNMVEKLTDPLIHLMRNALEHGIEDKETRHSKGKADKGTIELKAYHKGGAIMIDIIDDGKGINTDVIRQKAIDKGLINANDQLNKADIYDLLFEPGFSTAAQISDISDRGVGMDVVKKNIQELGGSIEVTSKVDEGSCFSLRLPLTLSIIDGQLFRIDEQIYIIPITSIIELIQVESSKIKHIAGQLNEAHKLRDHYIPVIRLNEVISSTMQDSISKPLGEGLLIVVEAKKKKVGLYVHELLSQQQVVMKSLEENFKKVKGISAATILGDGKVALIVDVDGLYELASQTELKKNP